MRDGRFYLKIGLGLIGLLVIVSYSGYQMRHFLQGPRLAVDKPLNGKTVRESLVSIEGKASNIAFIYLDDRQIFIDTNGYFNEKLLLHKGYNIITLEAKDKFDRLVKKHIEVMYE